jgi:hypothetical protein
MTFPTDYDRPLRAALDALEQHLQLDSPASFVARMEALDQIEFDLPGVPPPPDDAVMQALWQRAEVLQQRLEVANTRLFDRLRAAFRADDQASVRRFLEDTARLTTQDDDGPGYDALDMLVNGLLDVGQAPAEAAALEADLVFYQPTPAHWVVTMAALLQPETNDVFYDLGSGLGHVPILLHLLTGVRANGVELEASYCEYARRCAAALDITAVTFIHADARQAPFADGTLFYLYTPFVGDPLRQVLGRLEQEARQRPIRICSYGPCTAEVARQPWLTPIFQHGTGETRFGIFETIT